MATTSSNLTAGTAIGGQGGNGKGHKGRAAGLVATAALGLGLLAGVVLGRAHQAAAPASGQDALAARAGGAVRATGDARFLEQNAAGTRRGTGQQRRGSASWSGTSTSPPQARRARSASSGSASWSGIPSSPPPRPRRSAPTSSPTARTTGRRSAAAAFVPDPFTYREDHRAGTCPPPSCRTRSPTARTIARVRRACDVGRGGAARHRVGHIPARRLDQAVAERRCREHQGNQRNIAPARAGAPESLVTATRA